MKKLLAVLAAMMLMATVGFASIPEMNRSLPMQVMLSQIEMCTNLPYGDTFVFAEGPGETRWFIRTKNRGVDGWKYEEVFKLHTKAQY